MQMKIKYIVVVFAFLLGVLPKNVAYADYKSPKFESNPYDLIGAVNGLRASYGLPAYVVSSILMSTAQNQADFMAVTGEVTHSGSGGSTFTQRLLGAGYPLAGDLSLGGFRSENIIAGNTNMLAQDAVNAWMGDAPHQNTMLSGNLTEIGAGVAVANGKAYYVIDCARPTSSGVPQIGTQIVVGGTAVPAAEAVVYPVVVSTPNAEGKVIHEVKPGQALWSIAIAYGVKIDDIKRQNNLFGNDIYPGEKLLVKIESTPILTDLPTQTSTAFVSMTAIPTSTATPVPIHTETPPTLAETSPSRVRVMAIAMIIIIVAVMGAIMFVKIGGSRREVP
jgi:LysM repeat protein